MEKEKNTTQYNNKGSRGPLGTTKRGILIMIEPVWRHCFYINWENKKLFARAHTKHTVHHGVTLYIYTHFKHRKTFLIKDKVSEHRREDRKSSWRRSGAK